MTIATSFLRPHMKYRMEAAKRHKNVAIKSESLDSYLYDVVTSAAFFFVMIGPVCYRTYVKGLYIGEDEKPEEKKEEEPEQEDRYATMLKKLQAPADEDSGEQPKVTFADYERFLDSLDAQQKLEMLEESNPKSVDFHDQEAENMKRMDTLLDKELRRTLGKRKN